MRKLPAVILPFPQREPVPTNSGPAMDLRGSVLDVYHLLAREGELTAAEIASGLGLSGDQVLATVAELADLRLVRETSAGGMVAIPHSAAIDDLLGEQALLLAHAVQRISDGRRRLQALVDNRGRLNPLEAGQITSTTMGGLARLGLFELPRPASDTISAMQPGGGFSDDLLERSLARAAEALKGNIRMRVVHQSSVLGHPSVIGYLTELAAMGCRVRLRDTLPFQLFLIDGTSALCAVPASGSYLLKGERVMVLLNRVFETTWVDALPLEQALLRVGPAAVRPPELVAGPTRRSVRISPTHEAILRLLAEGQTDKSIARSMGITARTVTRRISEIYAMLGVESRFQAGIVAKEFGIV